MCLSHSDLIAENGFQTDSNDTNGGEGDSDNDNNNNNHHHSGDDDNDSSDDHSDSTHTDANRSSLSSSQGRRHRRSTLKPTSNGGRARKSLGSKNKDDNSVFRALAASCKRRGALLNRIQRIIAEAHG